MAQTILPTALGDHLLLSELILDPTLYAESQHQRVPVQPSQYVDQQVIYTTAGPAAQVRGDPTGGPGQLGQASSGHQEY